MVEHQYLFKVSTGHAKKAAKWQFKKIYMYAYLLLYQSLYDITNPIGHN